LIGVSVAINCSQNTTTNDVVCYASRNALSYLGVAADVGKAVQLTGIYAAANFEGTATAMSATSYIDGGSFYSAFSGTGTVPLMRGIYSNRCIVEGTVTNSYGLYIADHDVTVGATVTNNYGLYLENADAGTTLNYAVYSAGGDSYWTTALTTPVHTLNQSSTGDSYLRFALSTTISYALGIDNSVTGDPFVLSTAASGAAVLGTGNLLSITSAGDATLTGTFQATRAGFGVAPDGTIPLYALATTEQLRLSYSAGLYVSHTVDASGNLTIAPTSSVTIFPGLIKVGNVAGSHVWYQSNQIQAYGGSLYLNYGGNDVIVGSGGSSHLGVMCAPSAWLEVRGTTEQLRLSYSAAVYTSMTTADGGTFAVVPTGGYVGLNIIPTTAVSILAVGTDTVKDSINDYGPLGLVYLQYVADTTGKEIGLFGGSGYGSLSSGIGFTRENSGTWGTQIRFYTHQNAITTTDEIIERMRITADGWVGIGGAPSYPVHIYGTETAPQTHIYYMYVNPTISPGADTGAGTYYCLDFAPLYSNQAIACTGGFAFQGASVNPDVRSQFSGTVYFGGFYSSILFRNTVTGTIAHVRDFDASGPEAYAAGLTITDIEHFCARDSYKSTGTFTNQYGLRVYAQTAATNNWAIKTEGGLVELLAGNISLFASPASWQSMVLGMFIGNVTTAPTGNPAAGGFLYSVSGALTWRGSSGTVTTVAAARPRCEKCGYDFWSVATVNPEYKAWAFRCGHCNTVYKGGPQSVLNQLTEGQKGEVLRKDMSWEDIRRIMDV
jgi:hypothetical protein